MPIYQYAPEAGNCPQCGGHFDVIQKIDDPPLTLCPQCDRPVHREICPVALGGSLQLQPSDVGRNGFVQYRRLESNNQTG